MKSSISHIHVLQEDPVLDRVHGGLVTTSGLTLTNQEFAKANVFISPEHLNISIILIVVQRLVQALNPVTGELSQEQDVSNL